MQPIKKTVIREFLQKRKDQYSWPSCTNDFWSTYFYTAFFLPLYKASYRNKRVNRTLPSPSVRGMHGQLTQLTKNFILSIIQATARKYFNQGIHTKREGSVQFDLLVLTSLDQLLLKLKNILRS